MSELPDDLELAYVSKATFTHLWEKFKQTEQALAESARINQSLAASALRLGNECRDSADQVKGLREELARVMEDLHTANDTLAGLRADHKWLCGCLVTRRSVYQLHILNIGKAVCDLADYTPSNDKTKALWDHYEKVMQEATRHFQEDTQND